MTVITPSRDCCIYTGRIKQKNYQTDFHQTHWRGDKCANIASGGIRSQSACLSTRFHRKLEKHCSEHFQSVQLKLCPLTQVVLPSTSLCGLISFLTCAIKGHKLYMIEEPLPSPTVQHQVYLLPLGLLSSLVCSKRLSLTGWKSK